MIDLERAIPDAELLQAIDDIEASLRAGRVRGSFDNPRSRSMKFNRAYFETMLAKFRGELRRRNEARR